jgi:hypothetical protein
MDAIRRGLPTLPERMLFVNWDHRPAVLDGDVAFAVLVPGKPWVSVDRNDVFHTSSVLTEDAWRKRFFGRFGKLDLWAVYAATSRLPVLPEIEAPPIAP